MRKLILMMNLLPAIALANPSMPDHPPRDHFGQPPRHGFKEHGDRMPPFLLGIELSQKQRDDIKSLLQAQQATIEDSWNKERTAKQALQRLSFSSEYSDAKATALIEESMSVHKEIALQKTRLDNAIFHLLTADQQQTVQGKLAELGDY